MQPSHTSTARAGRIARWLQPRELELETEANVAGQILESAARLIAPADPVLRRRSFDALRRREQAGSTAIGYGFAIPHARIGGIDHPVMVYLRTPKPIPFDETGGEPVSHFIVFVVPSDGENDDHLQLLAAVARLIAERRFRRELNEAMTATEAASAFRAAIARTRE